VFPSGVSSGYAQFGYLPCGYADSDDGIAPPIIPEACRIIAVQRDWIVALARYDRLTGTTDA
jgi:hypothetical protein